MLGFHCSRHGQPPSALLARPIHSIKQCSSAFPAAPADDRKTLYQFAKHHETGEPLPEELYQRLLAARTYR